MSHGKNIHLDCLNKLKCISNQSTIPNGTDLNNWKIPGYYATGLNEHNCKNTPVEVSKLLFYLIVLKAYYTYQILFSGNSKLYIRVFNEDNKTWNSWN